MTLHHTFNIFESVPLLNIWKKFKTAASTTPLICLGNRAGIWSKEGLHEVLNVRGSIIAGMEGCELFQVFMHVLLL